MSDYDFTEGFEAIAFVVGGLLLVFVPLGLWKLVEIIIWVFQHISVVVK